VPIRLSPASAGCGVGRRLARASRERRSSCSGASPRRQRFAADEAGEAYLAECPLTSPAGRTDSAARPHADALTSDRLRLADDASAPRAGTRSQRRRGPRSIGPGPSRCVIGWRARPETFAARPETFAARPETFAARPETFAACGFSDLRAGFVLRDESSRRRRSRALHGSRRAGPEHGAGSPVPGTRPPPLAILRTTNWARISEERDESVVRGCWPARFRPRLRARPGSRARSPIYSPS